jgi:hypothetical protein
MVAKLDNGLVVEIGEYDIPEIAAGTNAILIRFIHRSDFSQIYTFSPTK